MELKSTTCPKLYLAPMEGVGSQGFRRSLAKIGGFDEACTEFLRVPSNAHVKSLAKRYDPKDTLPIPQAAQIMGSIPSLMGDMSYELELLGAPRIDLNCGCPSNTVTGRGAGSSLLKTPHLLYEIAKAMKDAISVPLSVKLRSGFADTSLFKENILAAQEAGASFITLHPRRKIDGYSGKANWDFIRQAKELLSIPVVGNGDILTPQDAESMLKQTGCDALMIGRGAVINPWIFHQIKLYFGVRAKTENWEETYHYFLHFAKEIGKDVPERSLINQLKQLFGFLFLKTPHLQEKRYEMLRLTFRKAEEFLEKVIPLYKEAASYG
jgi:tRNA-dihydrouridine synthase C